MPAYHAGSYIGQAVASVIAQSYSNWELIIVNDGSTDQTEEEIKKLGDSRIKTFYQENAGQCAAANKAFSLSSGTLIKFMDADDLISPDFIREQVNVLQGRSNSIAFGSWGRFYNDDVSTFQLQTSPLDKHMAPAEWLIASMTGQQVMLQCALWLIPRTLLNRSGLWNEALSLINDFEFIIRVLLQADELLFAKDAVLYYRSGTGQSLSATTTLKGATSAFHSIDRGTQHLLNFENSPRVRAVAADCFQRFVFTFYPQYRELTNSAEQKVRELGGTTIAFPAGGYTKTLAGLLGWKMAKKIKRIIN
jgi:hypothetical protein